MNAPRDDDDLYDSLDGDDIDDDHDIMEEEKDRRAAMGVKVNAPTVYPWDRFDRNAKVDPKKRFCLALNDHDKAVIRQLAAWRGVSMQVAILQCVRAAAVRTIKQKERRTREQLTRRNAS